MLGYWSHQQKDIKDQCKNNKILFNVIGWKKVFKFTSIEKAWKYLDKLIPIAVFLKKKIRKLQFIKDDQRSQVKFLHARNEVRNKHIYKNHSMSILGQRQ